MEEVLGLTGAQRRDSDSLKVIQQAKTRDGLQAKDLSTKCWQNHLIQRIGRHLSPGILPQVGRTLFPHNNALFQSLLPPSNTGQSAQNLAHVGCSASRSLPPGWDRTPRYRRKEAEPQGVVILAPPRPESGTDKRKGRRRTGRLELTPLWIPSAPRMPWKIGPTAAAKAKDQAGRGWAAEGSCACALGGWRHPGRGSVPGAFSRSPSPEVKGLPGGTLWWGRGRTERGPRTPRECLIPKRTRRGEMVSGGCTYSRCRCCRRHLRCCRHRLKKPHPSACSWGDSAWEGPEAGAARLLLLVVVPSFL